jgi:hypothetical protein
MNRTVVDLVAAKPAARNWPISAGTSCCSAS